MIPPVLMKLSLGVRVKSTITLPQLKKNERLGCTALAKAIPSIFGDTEYI